MSDLCNGVCNSCGAPNDTRPCSHCPTLLCGRCKPNHEAVCKQNQKRVSLGQGPTVRHLIEIPTAHPKPVVKDEIDQVIDNLAALIKAEN